MEQENLTQNNENAPDTVTNGPDRGERRKWGKEHRRFFWMMMLASAVCAVSLIVTVYNTALGRGCLLLYYFHIPCPGCGLTRANLAFLRGDLATAFGYHPVFFMPQLICVLGLSCAVLKKYRRLILWTVVVCIAVFISVWILRISFFGWRG